MLEITVTPSAATALTKVNTWWVGSAAVSSWWVLTSPELDVARVALSSVRNNPVAQQYQAEHRRASGIYGRTASRFSTVTHTSPLFPCASMCARWPLSCTHWYGNCPGSLRSIRSPGRIAEENTTFWVRVDCTHLPARTIGTTQFETTQDWVHAVCPTDVSKSILALLAVNASRPLVGLSRNSTLRHEGWSHRAACRHLLRLAACSRV